MIIENKTVFFDGTSITLRFPVVEAVLRNDMIIACYDWSYTSWKDNIECFDRLGKPIWIVNGRNLDDWSGARNPFVGFRDRQDRLIAFTFSGTRYYIDIGTGKSTIMPYEDEPN